MNKQDPSVPAVDVPHLSDTPASFALQELCVLADMPVRTVRYYISLGLVDKPQGETRAARYHTAHLEQLLLIKRWSAQGLGLERIRELLQAPDTDSTPARAARAGDIEVCSHLRIAEGLELVIAPSRAQLNPEQLRQFSRLVLQAHAQVMTTHAAGPAPEKSAGASTAPSSSTTPTRKLP